CVSPDVCAAGRRRSITTSSAEAPTADVKAIASHVKRVLAPATAGRRQHAEELLARLRQQQESPTNPTTGTIGAGAGAANEDSSLYVGACAICHEPTGEGFSAQGIPLSLSKVVALPDPSNLIHVILDGIEPPDGAPFALMPGFDGALTDEQVVRLAEFVRRTYSDQPPWRDVAAEVRKIRRQAAKS